MPTEPPSSEAPEAPPPRRARLRTLGSLALVVVSTLFGFAITELGVRLAAPQQLIEYRSDVYAPSSVYGYTHTANADTRVNTGERTIRFITDARGFRVGEAGRGDAEPRLLLLGDSFLQAIQVEHGQSYAGLLESRLPRRIGRPVTVRNTGVAGWNVNHYVIQARQSLAEERFAGIVVSITIENDFVEERVEAYPPREMTLRHDFRLPRRLTRAELVDAIAYPINDRLENRSHLYVLARRQLGTVRMRLGLSPLSLPGHYYRSEAAWAGWDTTAAVLAHLAALAGEHRVPVVVVLLPSNYQVDEAAFAAYVRGFGLDPATIGLDQPNHILASLLRQRGVEVLDALPSFREAAARGVQLYGRVDPHLSPEGHEEVYRLIEPAVLRMLAPAEEGAR